MKQQNIFWVSGNADRASREQILGQKGIVVWLTGLSGSGKSTLALALEQRLLQEGRLAFRLDGDNIRHGLNADLGFSDDERSENIRRIAEVAALFAEAGVITIVAVISPYRKLRKQARRIIGSERFIEVYIKADIDTCRSRDPKGLYAKVMNREIKEFTGVDSPYEAPENPDLVIDTTELTIETSVEVLADKIRTLYRP